jgi:hypothetical protein
MAPQLQAAYGGVGGTGVYPAAHPGLAVPTASGATATTQFPKGYASRYLDFYLQVCPYRTSIRYTVTLNFYLSTTCVSASNPDLEGNLP